MAKTRWMNDMLGHTVGGAPRPLTPPPAPAPTYAELAESTLDDLLNEIPSAEASAASIVRGDTEDIVVFTATRLFYISGTHISVREFATQAAVYTLKAVAR